MWIKKAAALLLLIGLLVSVLCSCGTETEQPAADSEDLTGKKIGVITGSIHDKVALENLKDPVLCYYNATTDLGISLETGKIDAYINDEPIWRNLSIEYPDQKAIKWYSDDEYAFVFQKSNEKSEMICRQLNAFLRRCRSDGTLQEIDSIWFGTDESKKIVDMEGLTAVNGTLTFATSTDVGMPFAYIKNNQFVGYDVDIAVRFCRAYGYGINITNSSFDGMLASVSGGKSDFCAGCITITEERRESMLFSDADYIGGTVLVTRDTVEKPAITSLDQLVGKRLGIQTGVAYDRVASEKLPESKLVYLNAGSDLAVALEKGKVDAYLIDEPIARMLLQEYPSQKILTILEEESYAWTIPKSNPGGRDLCEQFDEFFVKCRRNGTFAEVDDIWFGSDTSRQVVDFSDLPAVNGTLSMAICTTVGAPFCYIKDNEFAGYDLDFAVRFCREYGYGLKVTDYDLPGLFTCLSSGKCDFAACCIAITEERKETMLFSEPNYHGGIAVIVKDTVSEPEEEKTDFFTLIINNFYKTFIRENRYQLFLSGIGTTLLIVLLSLLFGTVIGFAMYLLYYRSGNFCRTIVHGMMRITENTPVVVILMILYYIIFGRAEVSGVFVSIVGFTLIFTGSVIGLMKMGVGAVDVGQREAALALGYNENQTFMRVILPQAAAHFLPGYKSAIVQLIKGTAIVGYIAVQDLTKISDIIRSRTYEAFFPLIVTAILYYLMAVAISVLVKHIEIKVSPAARKKLRLLKGVKTK